MCSFVIKCNPFFFRNLINIDVSKIVIKQMKAANIKRPELIFEEMDATSMSYPDGQFSVVLDKGTLDALMPDDKEETKNTIAKYFDVRIAVFHLNTIKFSY